jgi:IS30 family transposase
MARGVVVTRGDRPSVADRVPDDPMMRVSHETIYQSIYVQGRGELGRELARSCAPAGFSAGQDIGPRPAGGSLTW